jgi:hypothetical protein
MQTDTLLPVAARHKPLNTLQLSIRPLELPSNSACFQRISELMD